MIIFSAIGLEWCAERIGRGSFRQYLVPFGAAVAIAVGHITTPIGLQHVNMGPAAKQFLQMNRPPAVALVATSTPSEAEELSFVAEVASLDQGDLRYAVLRGGKLLAKSSWLQTNYRLVRQDEAGVLDAVEAVPTSTIVLSSGPGTATPHSVLVRRMLDKFSDKWKPMYSEQASNRLIEIFVATPVPKGKVRLPTIDMGASLGRSISAPF